MTNLPSICIEVDELTPCLRDLTTGKLVQTSFDKITISEQVAQELRKGGWLFDWADVADFTVVKLHIVGSDLIQGLVPYHNEKGYVKLDLAESAPYNRGRNKQYSGVGGNLFAIAAKVVLMLAMTVSFCLDRKQICVHIIRELWVLKTSPWVISISIRQHLRV